MLGAADDGPVQPMDVGGGPGLPLKKLFGDVAGFVADFQIFGEF